MTLPRFDYAEPASLRQANALLKKRNANALPIAGGTDLLQSLKYRLKSPALVVDLNGIPRLNRISYSAKLGLQIGALVSLRQLAENALVQEKYPALGDAARQVGTLQLQTMGTVGGNLCQDTLCLFYNRPPMTRQMLEPCLKLDGAVCHTVSGSQKCWATYSGDLAPVLLVLRAQIKIADAKGQRWMPLAKLYSGDGLRPNILKPGQILTEIRIPPPAPDSATVYLKLRVRHTIDYPLLGVAVSLKMKQGICQDARLALTAVDSAPIVVAEAENLKGKPITDDDLARLGEIAYKRAHPVVNVSEYAPAYRKEMVKVYVRNAMRKALESLGG